MKWTYFRKLVKNTWRIKHRMRNNDEYTWLLSVLINNLNSLVVRELFVSRLILFSNKKKHTISNIKLIESFEVDSVVKIYDKLLVMGGYIELYARDYNSAFSIRKIGHESGFKYSRVYPPLNSYFPRVKIRSTERILIPLVTERIEELGNMIRKINSEIISKNKKRTSLLIKKLEKLKY